MTWRASKSRRRRAVALGEVGGKQGRRRARLRGQRFEHPPKREGKSRRRVGRKRVDFPAFAADPRGESEPGALAPAGIALEGCEIEVLRRIEFIEPRVEHRLELGARQREGVDRGQERQRGRVARGFRLPFALDDAAPPCEPQGCEVGIAGAHARLADLEVEGGEGMQRVASVRRA